MRNLEFDFVNENNMNLLTDFYELTMCAGYFENHENNAVIVTYLLVVDPEKVVSPANVTVTLCNPVLGDDARMVVEKYPLLFVTTVKT